MFNGVLGYLRPIGFVLSGPLGFLMAHILPALVIVGPFPLGSEEQRLIEVICPRYNARQRRVGNLLGNQAAVGESVKAVGYA